MAIREINPSEIQAQSRAAAADQVATPESGQGAEIINITEFLTQFPRIGGRPNPLYAGRPQLEQARQASEQGMRLAWEVEQRFLEMLEADPEMFRRLITGESNKIA